MKLVRMTCIIALCHANVLIYFKYLIVEYFG